MMKVVIVCLLFLITSNILYAQYGIKGITGDPIIPEKSILFANDIYINDQPGQNQRTMAICSAFNGWLYASYTYSLNNQPWLSLFRSIDSGKTWAVLINGADGYFGDYFIKTDLIACGTDTSNLKLFFGEVKYHSNSGYRTVAVTRFNCSTGQFEQSMLGESSHAATDLSLATDFMFPAINSNPSSIGAVYSLELMYPSFRDTLIFCSSSNGGMSFDNRIGIGGSGNYLHKVSLAYGRSLTYNTGRYFVAWEEKLNSSSTWGHIYTAHTEPNFNSSFTSPYLLDVDATFNNKVKNPSISCQFSATNNDSLNLTEIILCEKYNSGQQNVDIAGFYNKTGTTSHNFNPLFITSNPKNNLQPDICFNPFDLTFITTYFDSTSQNLPYLTNSNNLVNPNSWDVISNGYNDNPNLSTPEPKIRLAFDQQAGACVWIAERSNGNGATLFDAPFNYPVGIKKDKENLMYVNVFPNPSSTYIEVKLFLEEKSDVKISIFNNLGQSKGDKLVKSCPLGENQIIIDVSHFNPGVYMLYITSCNIVDSRKFIVK